jgi:four helix bundle protein
MIENCKSDYREKMSQRLLEFAIRIMKLEIKLCKTYSGRHIYKQLFRAGTSSGANYEESVAAESKADFIHKSQIVLKELRESNYWVQLISKSNLISKDDPDLIFLLPESIELIRIFSKSLVTAKLNQKSK